VEKYRNPPVAEGESIFIHIGKNDRV